MSWFFTALALWGTWLNARQKRQGFYFWIIADIYISWLNFSLGEPAMGLLFAIYAGLAGYGLAKWKEDENV